MTHTILEKLAAWSRLYDFNFATFSELVAGQTISSPSVVSSPSGLTVGSPTVSSALVQVRLSGGTAGTDYSVTCSVTTSGSSTLTIVGILKVR